MYFKIAFIQSIVQPVLQKLPRKAVFNCSIKTKNVSLHELIAFLVFLQYYYLLLLLLFQF